jgi:hypothetical protein
MDNEKWIMDNFSKNRSKMAFTEFTKYNLPVLES